MGKESPDTQNLDYIVRTGVAGGVAGCAAKTVVAPLDRVKILFQANNKKYSKYSGSFTGVFRAVRDIRCDSGVRGLYQGHSATLLRIFPYAAIKFMSFEQFKSRLMPTKDKETPLRKFAAGSLAGVTTVLFTYPLELIRVRLAFETLAPQPPSILKIISSVWHEGGRSTPAVTSSTPSAESRFPSSSSSNRIPSQLPTSPSPPPGPAIPAPPMMSPWSRYAHKYFPILNFYRGFTPTLFGMVPYAGISFYLYGSLKQYCRAHLPFTHNTSSLPTPTASPSTTHSSGSSSVSTTPASNSSECSSTGLISTLSCSASYIDLSASTPSAIGSPSNSTHSTISAASSPPIPSSSSKTSSSPSISPSSSSSPPNSTTSHPLTSSSSKKTSDLTYWCILACGGLAGGIAQTVSYPMEVIRRRMQVGGAIDPLRFDGTWRTAKIIFAERGVRGFFVGLTIGYLKVAPMSAVSFLVYEEMKNLLRIE